MTKSNKQVMVDFIISCLKRGEERGKILTKVVKKWQTNTRSFDRLLKIAKDQHAESQRLIKEELERVDREAAIAARKKEIMTTEERKKVLTKIANGTLRLTRWWVGKGYEVSKQVVPNYPERISAIAELNKMEGDYAPTKIANTDTEGNYVKQVFIVNGKEIEF